MQAGIGVQPEHGKASSQAQERELSTSQRTPSAFMFPGAVPRPGEGAAPALRHAEHSPLDEALCYPHVRPRA